MFNKYLFNIIGNLLGTIPNTYLKTFEVIIQYRLSIRF